MTAQGQQIRFCTTHDGVRLAYATTGTGAPLVRTANWLSNLEHEWANPIRRPTLEALSRHFSLLRYDQRGCGLSDRAVKKISFEAWLDDLDTVVNAAGLRRFSLYGASQGCAISIAYAARHPEKISHLILYGGYALGKLRRDLSNREIEEALMLQKIIELGWGKESPEFRQVFTTQFVPQASADQQRAFDEFQRMSTSAENVVRIVREFDEIDVRDLARKIRCPTLVLHARHDGRVPFDEGLKMAALIPGARFVTLESHNHLLLASDPAFPMFVDEVVRFPHEHTPIAVNPASENSLTNLTAREQTVVELIAQGHENTRIAQTLGLSEKTIRNYVSSIMDKLQMTGRSQLIVFARESGYGYAAAQTVRRDASP